MFYPPSAFLLRHNIFYGSLWKFFLPALAHRVVVQMFPGDGEMFVFVLVLCLMQNLQHARSNYSCRLVCASSINSHTISVHNIQQRPNITPVQK